MLMHDYGDGFYLTQQLESGVMKNFTPYQISFKFKANANDQKGAKYKFQVGNAEFNTDYYSSAETPASTTSIQTFTKTFVTPATIVDQPYVQIYRSTDTNANNLDYFDAIILVAATGGGIGITGASGATFLSGSAYAPEGVLAAELAAERYGNATMRVTNPNFDTNKDGWTSYLNAYSNTVKESDDTKPGTTNFWENWNNTANEGRMFQVISDMPSGTYELQIMAFADQLGTMTPASTSVAVYAQGKEVGTSGSSYVRPNYVNSTAFRYYKTYAYVDGTGKLEIGMRQYSPAEFGWLCMDNVTLKYIATDNQEEAKLLALYQEKWTAVKAALKEDLDASTYAHITGSERTVFSDDIADGVTVSELADYKTNADAAKSTRATFIADATKNAYDEYYYEQETATRLGADASGVSTPTTAAEATTAAHAINVINYNQFVAEEYADVSETVLGDWTDVNVTSRTGEHWDGTTGEDGSPYFEQNEGWSSATAWSMSRQQTVELAAGSYVLRVAVRAAAGVNAELSVKVGENDPIVTYVHHHGGIGKGIETSGAANFGDGSFANTTGRCWEWRYIPFTVASTGNVTLKFNAENTSGLKNQYVSFCNLGIWTDPKVAARTALLTAISNATSARNSTNEGTGVFQIPSAAGTALAGAISTAQGVYDDDEATLSEINDATTAMTTAQTTYESITLNTPADGTRYCIKVATAEHATLGNAVVVALGATSDNNPTGYTFNASAKPSAYLNQAFVFTQKSGNEYYISIERPEGEVYLTYGSLNGSAASWKTQQIQGTTDSSKKGTFKIVATTTANVFKIYNTEHNDYIDCEDAGNLYTITDAEKDLFTLEVASQATVNVAAKAGKFGTIILPFAYDFSSDGDFADITFYSISGIGAESLTLAEVATPAANTPYIIKNSGGSNFSKNLSGYGTAKQDSYVAANLTGVYTAVTIPASEGSDTRYILQTQEGAQAFYKVEADFTAKAYRCYLTVTGGETVKAFFFDNDETAISSVKADELQGATIYNLAGQRVSKAQKGVYIINGKKVAVK